ncbi:iron-sulfur protein [Clostridioides difficile]|uniref:EFR1 family ferrodoxin n=2 Tax=Clostridioides difficile TaxID=1496 RepID=UPI000BB1B659|nr:EFR1 family ferrodoxin [Clostridioides difficile]PBG39592.1 iron-sulfur protein [Clostridioides difficile]
MIGIYFSGTGNSRYCVEKFLQEYDITANSYYIEDNELLQHINNHENIIFSYPVQYSNVPKILKDFIINHSTLWNGKRVFIIATMALFSGDGSGVLARILKKYGAITVGGLHVKMPDSIGDEKVLKHSLEYNRKLVIKAEKKVTKAAKKLKHGSPPKEGLGFLSHIVGLFGQRLYFINKTNMYTDKLKINTEECIVCGKCVNLCPMKNLVIKNCMIVANGQCTMCYRCVNNCAKKAITLLGKKVVEQSNIKKYM